MYSRRDFSKLALAAFPAAAALARIDSTVRGVQLGVQSYSFRDRSLDDAIKAMVEVGLGECELYAGHVEPKLHREELRNWRTTVSMDEFRKVRVGFHGHSDTKHPNEFSSPETFEKAMAGHSPYINVNLDIGHFFAAGFDPIDFINKHHERIVTLHIKDRKKNDGENMPFGQGDTPIKPVLQSLSTKKYRIPANIEYEYKGADTVAEVKKCLEYCKAALA